MDHGQHFTFCCFGLSDLNSHFKNLDTSSPSLTLGEPHKPKHTLSILSSKHDSMCHGKICIGQKIITQNPYSKNPHIRNYFFQIRLDSFF